MKLVLGLASQLLLNLPGHEVLKQNYQSVAADIDISSYPVVQLQV